MAYLERHVLGAGEKRFLVMANPADSALVSYPSKRTNFATRLHVEARFDQHCRSESNSPPPLELAGGLDSPMVCFLGNAPFGRLGNLLQQ